VVDGHQEKMVEPKRPFLSQGADAPPSIKKGANIYKRGVT